MSGYGHGVLVLDALGVATALLAAWWWHLSGTRRLRRVSRSEAFERLALVERRAAALWAWRSYGERRRDKRPEC